MQPYKATQYPNIYNKTYWGSSSLEPYNGITQAVINNRNNFIKELFISKCVDIPKYAKKQIQNELNLGIIDHLECYKNKDNHIILVSSPYNFEGESKIKSESEYIQNGWYIYDNLYSTSTTTYIKILIKQ
jgi:hypothetical protein